MYLVYRVIAAVVKRAAPGPHATRRLSPARRRLRPSSQRLPASRRMSRREALGLLIGGGSFTLGAGASGIGIFGTMRKLASKAGHPTAPGNAAIGSTTQARNTARGFINPRTGNASLLVRLPDGAFVGYEKACTHRGVFVAYDPATHRLVCPAHGAIFDPAHQGSVVQGPATRALPQVALHVAPDGSITAG